MHIKENPVLLWLKDIEKLRTAGHIICPLMILEPARFPASICPCDIPKTRARFFAEKPDELLCSVDSTCLPTIDFADEAADERNPGPPPRTRRPHGAWTASFRKLPDAN